MINDRIAIVGIGQPYSKNSAAELWENVLAGRYTVPGSPSLDGVVAAAKRLLNGDLDVAVADGVIVLMRESNVKRRSYALITFGADTVSYVESTPGVAGLIKATLAVYYQVIPGRLRAELFPPHLPIRAKVSDATGAQLVLEEMPGRQRRTGLSKRAVSLVAGRQDCELLLFAAPDPAALRARIALVSTLDVAELADLAATLAAELSPGPFRAALVAAGTEEARSKLDRLLDALDAGQHSVFDADGAVFLAHRTGAARIAYLFPGEGSGDIGAIRRRFPIADTLARMAGSDPRRRVAAGSLAGLRVLHDLGIDADVAFGSGVGELTALSWAGAMDGGKLLRLAAERPGAFPHRPPRRPVVSTVADAVAGADLVLEVGPGRSLSDPVGDPPVLAVDTGSPSLAPLLSAVGAAFTLGAAVDAPLLFADRAVRPIVIAPTHQPELPLARFIDRVLVHRPGVELVTEAELSAGSDPYLADYQLDGKPLFPAVLAMEAMAQVAMAASGRSGAPLLENVEFLQPVVVRHPTTIRISALVRDAEAVDVVIRGAETGADHVRATLRFPRPSLPARGVSEALALPPIPADPTTEFYGGAMFAGKRFQRLLAYRRAGARHAVAELGTIASAPWFAPFLPQDLVLADPGTRDAVMHSIQCCVPDATPVPHRIERLYLADVSDQDTDFVVVDARERTRNAYDVDVFNPSGRLIERWEGLVLREIKRCGACSWSPALVGSYLERSLERLLGASGAVVVEPDPVNAAADIRAQTNLAASRALGRPPRPGDRGAMSAAHGAGLTMVVTGAGRLGCHLAPVRDRTWVDLLGPQGISIRDRLVAETGERDAVAGTRVWCALVCLRTTGSATHELAVDRIGPDGWIVLSTGDARIATWVTAINNVPDPVVFAVLSGEET